MSCRIERLVSGEDCVVLRVSGRIRAEDVDTLRDSLRREKGRVAIDLTDVLVVGREAVKLLAFSEAKGTNSSTPVLTCTLRILPITHGLTRDRVGLSMLVPCVQRRESEATTA